MEFSYHHLGTDTFLFLQLLLRARVAAKVPFPQMKASEGPGVECLNIVSMTFWASLVAQLVKNPPAMQETLV